MSATILDAPDATVMAIFEKRRRGIRLTPKEEQRLQARLSAEAETERTGGTVKRSIVPAPAPGAQMTPGQKGAAEAQAMIDSLRGRDATMRKNGFPGDPTLPPATATGMDGAISATAKMRRSPITNDATTEQKVADNAAGPHIGADGQPATWKTPMRVAGRMNGASFDSAAPASAGGISMVGADGQPKIWKNGKFETLAPAAPAAATAFAASAPTPAVVNEPGDEPDVPGVADESDSYLDNPAAARSIAAKNFAAPPVVKPDAVQPSAPAPVVRADTAQPAATPPVIQPDAEQPQPMLAGMPTKDGAGISAMLEDATRGPISPAVKNAFAAPAPAPRPQPSIASPGYQPAPVMNIVNRRAPAVGRAISAVGNVLNPPSAAWNNPAFTGNDLVPTSIPKPKPMQADATVYDPFDEKRKRRAMAMQPE